MEPSGFQFEILSDRRFEVFPCVSDKIGENRLWLVVTLESLHCHLERSPVLTRALTKTRPNGLEMSLRFPLTTKITVPSSHLLT